MTAWPDPRDPVCGRLAADMPDLDGFWAESAKEVNALDEDEKQRRRAEYARQDGTYNPVNGHFLCDSCYIASGMPLGRCS
jgi:hypothetical protein